MPYEDMHISEDRSAIMLGLIAEMRSAATTAEFEQRSDELATMVLACAFPRIPGPKVSFNEQGEMLVI